MRAIAASIIIRWMRKRVEDDFEEFVNRFGRAAAFLVVVGLLLFPSSTSVLCIAPGNHVAIEDINALCCARVAAYSKDGNSRNSGFAGVGDCQNCTDLLFTPNEGSAILDSSSSGALDYLALTLSLNPIPLIVSPPMYQLGLVTGSDSPPPALSLPPMRC